MQNDMLQVLENVRGPVRFQVFPYTCVEMAGGLTDIAASCTAYTRKFINHTCSESIVDRVFQTVKRLPTLKEENHFTVND